MTLTENEYALAVNIVSPDDGRAGTVAYYTDHAKAHAPADRIGGRAVQTTIWKGSDGLWYVLPYKSEILVDAPTREEVLKKLTNSERKVLGL